MNEAGVKKTVEAYFTNTFQRFSVSQECVISFGSRQVGIVIKSSATKPPCFSWGM